MLANIAHHRRACIAGLVGVGLCGIFAPSLMAQGTGTLTGTVTDPAGVPVAFATVTTTSFATGQVLPAATGTNGIYRFSLPPGNYLLTFASPGYKMVEIPAATISGPWTVVRNCELEGDEQTQGNTTAEPAQKPAPSPSNHPTEPSLEDLGITAAQAKGNPQAQALLDRRT